VQENEAKNLFCKKVAQLYNYIYLCTMKREIIANHHITNISEQLAKEHGAHGTPERAKFDEEAYAFYTSQVLLDARKSAMLTQAELSKRIGADKSYISRIEKGITVPSVATFYRIVNALGRSVELVPA
jgi:DNA-binding XRE family transcriptional regulator